MVVDPIVRGIPLRPGAARPAAAWRDALPALPDEAAVTLLVADATHHRDLVVQVTQALADGQRAGLVVAATRPAGMLRAWFLAAGLREADLRYLDCISVAGGLAVPDDGRIMALPSRGALELVALRCAQWLERMPGRRFLVVDSVSALAMHNGREPVEEMLADLLPRLRRLRVPTVLLLADRQVPGLLEALRPLADAELRA